MSPSPSATLPLADFPLWEKLIKSRKPLRFELELTARCNNQCRHCYINLPAVHPEALQAELTLEKIKDIIDETAALGGVWCLLSGGEPLLRPDFADIYLYLKKKGILVSIFSNGTLITRETARLFQKYPPRHLELTVYGITEDTYERVTRTPGSFRSFKKGLELLSAYGIRVRLKAMALRSNYKEIPGIASFCRERTKDYFRFDPFLHLRLDGDPCRNEEIKSERLSADEIVRLELSDEERFRALKRSCDEWTINRGFVAAEADVFQCGIANGSFIVGHDGQFRLCSSLRHPEYMFDLRTGTIQEAWKAVTSRLLKLRSRKRAFLENCRVCSIIDLCMWCPAHAYLETGLMDEPVPYFCEVAHARAAPLKGSERGKNMQAVR